MKTCFITGLVLLMGCHCYCQAWTTDQLDEANTAAELEYLSTSEKQVIQYINLCRLYPQQFAANEVKNYKGMPGVRDRNLTKYKASLLKDLARRQPCEALAFDDILYEDAHCYVNELSTHRRTAHQRIDCEKSNYAECIFWGSGDGRVIALEWLVDCGVATLGHRKNCLNPDYSVTGIKIATHYQFGHCAVEEFE